MVTEPQWLKNARASLGLKEVIGKDTAPVIRQWLIKLGAWWTDDETPWCGVAVAAWMKDAGVPLPKHWYRARAWLDWGVPLREPALGCVVVYERGGSGHVGLVVGLDKAGRIMTIGGNQGNRVSIAPFDRSRVLGFRYPPLHLDGLVAAVPLLDSEGQEASRREA
jgi:uncharacterized protein (TIGR02594 family)